MLRKSIACLALSLFVSCSSKAPLTEDEKFMTACIEAAEAAGEMANLPENFRNLSGYKVASTAMHADMFCGDTATIESTFGAPLLMGEYKLAKGMERGTKCYEAGNRIMEPIEARMTAAYKADGTAFCQWYKGVQEGKGKWMKYWTD